MLSVFSVRLPRKYWPVLVVLIFLHLLIAVLIYYSISSESSDGSHFLPPAKIHHESHETQESKMVVTNQDDKTSRDEIVNIENTLNLKNEPLEFNPSELDFEPACNVKSHESISAINRATTQKCKQEIVNTACLMQSGKLYAKSLPRLCHLKEGEYGDYVGCFRDAARERSLSGYMVKLPTSNNPKKCTDLCLQSGHVYSGVESGTLCFCGDSILDLRSKLPIQACNTTCPTMSVSEKGRNHPTGIKEDRGSFCGGHFAVDIFRTGLKLSNKNLAFSEDSARDLEPVRIAFVFTVNGRAVRQIKRLVKNLYSPRHFYYFHVDERQDYLFRELLKLEHQFPANMYVARTRYSTIWGGASLLKVLLNSIHDLLTLETWSNNWDYVINLSESDFPLKSLERLELFLTANKGKNFVKSHGQQTQKFIRKQGLDKTFHECDRHMWKLGDRTLPVGIVIDGGSDWVALTHDFSSYLTYANNSLLRGLKQVFDHTLLPAESFFHTALQNSEYCDTIINNNLHVTNWRRKLGCNCQHKHVVDWCGCSPNDFTPSDWPKVRNSMAKDLYFGRKFEAVVSQIVINKVENLIQGTPNKIITDKSYFRFWQNMYHSQDSVSDVTDGQMSVFKSLSATAYDHLASMCSLPTFTSDHNSLDFNVDQVHLFTENEVLKALLVASNISGFDVDNKKHVVMVESYAKRIDHFKTYKRPQVVKRLIRFEVCSDLDQKEMIFRNYGCILSPFSELVTLHLWTPGPENFTVTFVYIDPAEFIAGVFDVAVISPKIKDRPDLYIQHKPNFKGPHRPGVWRLLMIFENNVIVAETKFLITPLYYYNQKEVSVDQAKLVNTGPLVPTTTASSKLFLTKPSPDQTPPEENLAKENVNEVKSGLTALESLIGITDESKKAGLRTAIINSRRIGVDLRKWIETLAAEFWTIRSLCVIRNRQETDYSDLQINRISCSSSKIDSCAVTSWSSLYPDIKAEIPVH